VTTFLSSIHPFKDRRDGHANPSIFENTQVEGVHVPLVSSFSTKAAEVPVRSRIERIAGRLVRTQSRGKDREVCVCARARARMLDAADGSNASKRDVLYHAVRRRRRDRSYVHSMPVQWTFSKSISR